MTDCNKMKEAVDATNSIISNLRNMSKLSTWFNINSLLESLKNEMASFKAFNKSSFEAAC